MTDLDRRILLGVAGIAGMAAVARVAQSGSLNPPSGPVTPTMKALDQVEPRTAVQSLSGDATSQYLISQPGAYYLTGNIVGIASMNGIKVTSSDVTIDLCGFSMSGVAASLDAITTNGGSSNVIVQNGTVTAWHGSGINLSGCMNSIVANIIADVNGGTGIIIGDGGLIRDCVSRGNTGDGIYASANANISRCTASGSASGNGIVLGNEGRANDCVATYNFICGISMANRCALNNCIASNNTGSGVTSNLGTGIAGGQGCTIIGCLAGNNSGNGIASDMGSSLLQNTAYQNALSGILAYNGSNIAMCTSTANGADGIMVNTNCVILNNNASNNGGSVLGSCGIRTASSANRIDGNMCNSNTGTGIHSQNIPSSDVTVRNTCVQNSTANYNPTGGTSFGPISTPNSASATAWSNF